MPKLITEKEQLVGKTIAAVIFYDDDYAMRFTDGDYAGFRSVAFYGDDGASEVSMCDGLLDGALLALGVIDQAELDKRRAASMTDYQKKQRADRRREYERLKKEFEPTPVLDWDTP